MAKLGTAVSPESLEELELARPPRFLDQMAPKAQSGLPLWNENDCALASFIPLHFEDEAELLRELSR